MKKSIQEDKLCGAMKPIPAEGYRVAFYIRVSTDTEDQQNSLENQRLACEATLRQHPEYRLVQIFQDEGISGTMAEKRPGFMEMVQAAEEGVIDLIITKSLSRWSRNTLDSLQYMRRLLAKGCNFIFERENLDTRQPFSEFALTLYSAFSQEESRSISENTKIGIRMNFQLGKARWCPIYGYRKGWCIYEPEARVVREIFDRYEQGHSLSKIALCLQESGIPTPRHGLWRPGQLQQMLRSSKYTGELVMQKFYTIDHLTHKQARNDGSAIPLYTLQGHHHPIVSREQFDRVQEMLTRRRYNAKMPSQGVRISPKGGKA